MNALTTVSTFLTHYGYYAIFALVFLQQVGVPNPVTNELILVFCGYLSYTGMFNFFGSAVASAAADIIGTTLVYLLFYSFSKWIVEHSPRWIPLKGEAIEHLKKHVHKRGMASIYIGRYTPFIRGYISVVAGMVHLDRKKFLSTVVFTSITWNAGLMLLGYLLAPYWSTVIKKAGTAEIIVLIVAIIIGITLSGRYFTKKQLEDE